MHSFIKRSETTSEVSIGEGSNLSEMQVFFHRPNCRLIIGKNCILRGHIYFSAPRCSVIIGSGTRTNSSLWMNLGEGDTSVIVGDRCLFSSVRFRTSDSHKIIDISSGERLNPPGDIIVGDSVWIAEDSLLVKGTKIGDGSVIGARSFVNSEIPPNSLAVGAPARVIREGIRWSE